MNDYTAIFAANIKERRKELNMTQRELAEIIGYTEKSVSKWESGKVIAPSVVLPALASCLKCDINRLFAIKNTPEYFLGIDGGGTKTAFLLCDKDGKTINETVLGPCNPVDIGISKTIKVIESGIDSVCKNIPHSKICAYVGVAGGITGNNQEIIAMFLKGCGFLRYANGSDASNAVALALGDKNGTAVIMGTGVIAFSQIDKKLIRRGGHGYIFERGGSAFALGRDAINAALMHEEHSGDETVITEYIKTKLNCKNILEQLSYFYEIGKKGIAEFASLVFDAYKQGDTVAKSILSDNMKDVARLIESTPKLERVVIVGGLTKQADIILPMIKENLKQANKYNIETNNNAPVLGAIEIAKRMCNENA